MTEESQYLQRLREALPAMQAERDALPPDSILRPSKMWLGLDAFLNFVFDLSDRNLRDIRLHTGFMTGVPWFSHLGNNRFSSDEAKLSYPMIRQYHDLTSDIPERFWGSEPVASPLLEMVGIRYKGRLITDDLVRYQRCVSNLYWTGVYGFLDSTSERPIMVEIGGGYGGLAHQIVTCFAKPCTYFIFDLPEILYWAAAFLIVNNPEKNIYIYNGKDGDQLSMAAICAQYDIALFPNFEFERIKELRGIDLAVNLLSFQEMSDAQIEFYCDILADRVRGALYSENFSRHPFSSELKCTVDEHLSRWFELTPTPMVFRNLYKGANSFDNPGLLWQLFPFVATPRNGLAQLCPVNRVIAVGDKRLRLD